MRKSWLWTPTVLLLLAAGSYALYVHLAPEALPESVLHGNGRIEGTEVAVGDELSLGVDPISRRELWRLLKDFRREGTAIVVTTSYMDEAGLCDRLALLDGGRLIATGTPQKLLERGAPGYSRSSLLHRRTSMRCSQAIRACSGYSGERIGCASRQPGHRASRATSRRD